MNLKELNAIKEKLRQIYVLNWDIIEISTAKDNEEIQEKAREIEKLIMDADGVLIDFVVKRGIYGILKED